jgi:hypothetical protein
MPYKDPEKRKEAQRRYAENNREKMLERKKLFYQNNKHKSYYQRDTYKDTPQFKKTHTISNWKTRGVVGDYDEMYNIYLNTNECNVCKVGFNEKNWKCLDHDHDTGKFRQILCNNCNTLDRWKNKIKD